MKTDEISNLESVKNLPLVLLWYPMRSFDRNVRVQCQVVLTILQYSVIKEGLDKLRSRTMT
jgi:hypothetical protein